ncbi:DUF1206 domain-containing protein [Gillisia sp. M10.2A]|uniref:DUF1206 domain-containing protein n=1 Tax=Gillisia lutea TaxID=2909668 RepID=A0ABS9EFN1_9FLAO|nr:DUF1206 domain-containing protein [Gillisia lutea]MCF4101676.1 DUF1206 domain-containing protein [Gillisia lutea]
MNDKVKKIARTGYAAKGIVYGITGVLTFLAAFNLGGQKTGKFKVMDFLDKQPFGNALLIIIGIGLLCYSFWRFNQAISDPENIGTQKKAIIKRVAFFISGCIYTALSFVAVKRVFSSSGSGNTAKQSSILATETGLFIIMIVGALLILTGIYQFIRLYKADFIQKFNFKAIAEEKRRKIIKNTAYMGLSSRGIIFMITGYFALKAGITSNPSKIKTTADAFSYMEDSSYGAYLLALVAAGLVGYAIYMLMTARYRTFK